MQYFTFYELEYSEAAISAGIKNAPNPDQERNLRLLVDFVLDPAREILGLPITVTSGFRTPKVNTLVGGVKNSQHMLGEAADITAGSRENNMALFDQIKAWGNYDQLIEYNHYEFIHVSYALQKTNRKEVLHKTKKIKTATKPKMKKSLLLAFLLLAGTMCHAQQFAPADTIFDFELYRSCYSYQQAAPSYVVYRLYQPKAVVKRDNLRFIELPGFSHFDYKGTPYDRGHLCPAADCAASLAEMGMTFYYVNALPQHYRLNRGAWKRYETAVRNAAQIDSLLVICGGANWGEVEDLVPGLCWKIVYSMTDTIPIMSLSFTNCSAPVVSDCDTLRSLFPFYKMMAIWKGGDK